MVFGRASGTERKEREGRVGREREGAEYLDFLGERFKRERYIERNHRHIPHPVPDFANRSASPRTSPPSIVH